MDFEFSPDELAFREEAAKFIAKKVAKPGVLSLGADGTRYIDTPARREFMKDLADAGYLGVSWDQEYGGRGLPPVYDYLLNEELALQGAPSTGKGVGIIGRSIITLGTAEQKAYFLPKILNADIEWAIGYTEPDSGSDLASMKLRAVKEDGGWRINGQKRFTTSAHFADWYFLAARTGTGERKHDGITLFLLRMDAPGIEINGLTCIDGERTNEVFLDDVFVPDDQVLGEVGKGFYYMSAALDYERHVLFPWGYLKRMYDVFIEWARTATIDGEPVYNDPDTRAAIAKLSIDLELARLLSISVVATDDPEQANVGSAMNKIAASEFYQEQADTALDLMGAGSWLQRDSEGAVGEGLFERLYRSGVLQSVGAGTNEIQRNIIARRGLKLPNPV